MEHFFGGIALLRGMRQMKLEEVANANLLLRVRLWCQSPNLFKIQKNLIYFLTEIYIQ